MFDDIYVAFLITIGGVIGFFAGGKIAMRQYFKAMREAEKDRDGKK